MSKHNTDGMRDITRYAYQAYTTAIKQRTELRDFQRGCTSTGEAGFFDLEFAYNTMEILFCSVNILRTVHKVFHISILRSTTSSVYESKTALDNETFADYGKAIRTIEPEKVPMSTSCFLKRDVTLSFKEEQKSGLQKCQ